MKKCKCVVVKICESQERLLKSYRKLTALQKKNEKTQGEIIDIQDRTIKTCDRTIQILDDTIGIMEDTQKMINETVSEQQAELKEKNSQLTTKDLRIAELEEKLNSQSGSNNNFNINSHSNEDIIREEAIRNKAEIIKMQNDCMEQQKDILAQRMGLIKTYDGKIDAMFELYGMYQYAQIYEDINRVIYGRKLMNKWCLKAKCDKHSETYFELSKKVDEAKSDMNALKKALGELQSENGTGIAELKNDVDYFEFRYNCLKGFKRTSEILDDFLAEDDLADEERRQYTMLLDKMETLAQNEPPYKMRYKQKESNSSEFNA